MMALTLLQRDAMAETFADTEKLIYKTVHLFAERYGGRFEDLIEHASFSFINTCREYDNSRGSFSTALRWCVWHDLLEHRRKQAKRAEAVTFTDLDPETYATPPAFDLAEFLDELSQDAKTVVRLVFDTPWHETPEPKHVRSFIREHLKQTGWTSQQITESFKEIRHALSA